MWFTAFSIRGSATSDANVLRLGAVIVGVAGIAAIVGPWTVPFDPAAQELALRLAGPSLVHRSVSTNSVGTFLPAFSRAPASHFWSASPW